MKDILNAVAKTRRALVKQYPGASDQALEGAVREMVTIALADPKASLEDAALLFDTSVDAAQEEWSSELNDILLEKIVRPEFDKAIEVGVDPVPVIRANCSLSEAKAREVVAKLTAAPAEVRTPVTGDRLMGDGSIVAKGDAVEEDVAPGADLGHGTRI